MPSIGREPGDCWLLPASAGRLSGFAGAEVSSVVLAKEGRGGVAVRLLGGCCSAGAAAGVLAAGGLGSAGAAATGIGASEGASGAGTGGTEAGRDARCCCWTAGEGKSGGAVEAEGAEPLLHEEAAEPVGGAGADDKVCCWVC